MPACSKAFFVAVLLALLFVSAAQGQKNAFGPAVKVTPTGGFGYEPSFVADSSGNIFATAHKENWQLVLAPDLNSPTYTRSMSWTWISMVSPAYTSAILQK